MNDERARRSVHRSPFIVHRYNQFLAGETLFMSVFRRNTSTGYLALANPIAGKIFPIQLRNNTILAERNAYLAAIGNVNLTVAFTKRFGAALFGGEGLFYATLTGPGHVLLWSAAAMPPPSVSDRQRRHGRRTPHYSRASRSSKR